MDFKNLMEKMKITASQAAEAAGKAADAASKKAGSVVENTKLNLQIMDINSDIEILYKEIGRSVYLTHTGVEVDADELENKLTIIDEKLQLIDSIRSELDEKKTSAKCPNCGKEYNKEDAFCASCGFELK
ncbi:MAG: zinc ribbon domain-containing protein [Clostridia bacterium]|nr:zinc ribbon domain-containing protein [Clostridia bacterium]